MKTNQNQARITDLGEKITAEIGKVFVGSRKIIEDVLATILGGGHLLFEDFPGLGKTLLANCFAQCLGLQFRRIQFTPDLLPGDITGGYIYDRSVNQFVFRKGPVFANIILADEINRASPKTQSALLEAMQEQQVTIEGETMALPKPFVVIATQNPIEYEGTYPLPEAQLDRFMVKLSIGYPSPDDELEILERRRLRRSDPAVCNPVTSLAEILAMQDALEEVAVTGPIERYIVDIVGKTRRDKRIGVGSSPRATLALFKLARVCAALDGRDFVIPDDVKRFVVPVLGHRIILTPDLWMKRSLVDEIIMQILSSTDVPVDRKM